LSLAQLEPSGVIHPLLALSYNRVSAASPMFDLGLIIAIVIRDSIPPRGLNRHLFMLLGFVLVVVLVQYVFGVVVVVLIILLHPGPI
jgi:hypothetical protein